MPVPIDRKNSTETFRTDHGSTWRTMRRTLRARTLGRRGGLGTLVSGSFVDYLLPTAAEVPDIAIEHLESPPQGPINFRGAGESGAKRGITSVAKKLTASTFGR